MEQRVNEHLVTPGGVYHLLLPHDMGQHPVDSTEPWHVIGPLHHLSHTAVLPGECAEKSIQGFMQDQIITSHMFWWTHGC